MLMLLGVRVHGLIDLPRLLRALLALVAAAPILLACAAPGQVGGASATPVPTTALPSTAAPSVGQSPSVAPSTAVAVVVGDADCLGYLGLVASTATQSAEAALTSYRCSGLYADSTGRYPASDSPLVLSEGEAVTLRLSGSAARRPDRLELRLYNGAGLSGSFLLWPEDYLHGIQPVDGANPPPSLAILYSPQAPPGVYSLVVLTSWSSAVDVFYAVSLEIAPRP
jgi:hypothetical protein